MKRFSTFINANVNDKDLIEAFSVELRLSVTKLLLQSSNFRTIPTAAVKVFKFYFNCLGFPKSLRISNLSTNFMP